mgnify:CR=1 FL=1
MVADSRRISNISLDDRTVVRRSPQVEHELKVAIYDLLDENEFALNDGAVGPYSLHLAVEDNRLVFDVRDLDEAPVARLTLPGSVFRRIVKDYFLICESYFEAIKTKTPSQIEAIDMARRGIHNEGAELLAERLAADVEMDKPTARRLFTLVCVLHIRA